MYHYHIDHLSRIYLSVFYLPITYISNFETQYLMCVKAACELLSTAAHVALWERETWMHFSFS